MTGLTAAPVARPWSGARLAWETGLYAASFVMAGALASVAAADLIDVAVRTSLERPLLHLLAVLLLPLTALQMLRWLAMLGYAMTENLAQARRAAARAGGVSPRRRPRVSILMPAYNEEQTLERAFRALLALDYPDVEVVFVDDGSTDGSLAIAHRFAGRHGHVTVSVHSKRNGGKWSALNRGLRHATGELVLFVDADSHLDPHALTRLHDALEERGAAAVAGYVRVRNRRRLLNWLQALEYLTCNGTMRAAQSRTGTVLVVAGPLGLYRRSVLERVFAEFGRATDSDEEGPMEGDTFAEDFDLSLAVLALGERIVYEPRAVAFTKAPESLCALLSQRYRWIRGSLQVLRKYLGRSLVRPELLRPKLVFWLLACYFVDYLLTPLLALFALLLMLASMSDGSVPLAAASGVLLLVAGSELTLALCFASSHREQRRLALVLPFRGIYSGLFLMSILPFVMWDELRRAPMRW